MCENVLLIYSILYRRDNSGIEYNRFMQLTVIWNENSKHYKLIYCFEQITLLKQRLIRKLYRMLIQRIFKEVMSTSHLMLPLFLYLFII